METNNQKNDQNIIPNDADKQQKGVNVPNLRFSQFAGNWVKVNIKDILKILYGKDYKDQDAGNIPVYGTGGIICYINHYLCNWNCVCIGRKGTINKPIYIDQPFWCVDTLFYSKAKNDNSPKFQYYLFQTINWDKFNEASSVPSLSSSTIENIKIFISNTNEQKKIADFLSLIDQRINTQSKIIEDLELFKKGIWNYIYLTKSSDWKCVKLSDILCERKDFALKEDGFIHATLSKDGIFAKTDRYDRDFLVTNDEKEYKITRLNDICYNPANLKFGVICLNKFGDAIFSPIYVTYIVKNDFIPSFVKLILTSSRFLKYIRKYEQGTVYERMAVNSEDFLKGEILIPTKDKQKAIADYFDMLDLKIKKEKDILELYKKQKAYLLKNMFI